MSASVQYNRCEAERLCNCILPESPGVARDAAPRRAWERRLVSRFRSSHHCAAHSVVNFGIEGHWRLIDLVWLWFRSPHFGLAGRVMRTSGPPHWAFGNLSAEASREQDELPLGTVGSGRRLACGASK